MKTIIFRLIFFFLTSLIFSLEISAQWGLPKGKSLTKRIIPRGLYDKNNKEIITLGMSLEEVRKKCIVREVTLKIRKASERREKILGPSLSCDYLSIEPHLVRTFYVEKILTDEEFKKSFLQIKLEFFENKLFKIDLHTFPVSFYKTAKILEERLGPPTTEVYCPEAEKKEIVTYERPDDGTIEILEIVWNESLSWEDENTIFIFSFSVAGPPEHVGYIVPDFLFEYINKKIFKKLYEEIEEILRSKKKQAHPSYLQQYEKEYQKWKDTER